MTERERNGGKKVVVVVGGGVTVCVSGGGKVEVMPLFSRGSINRWATSHPSGGFTSFSTLSLRDDVTS